MTDIAPGLLEAIRDSFLRNLENNARAAELLAKIEAGAAGYAQAGEYAYEIGSALSDAFSANLSSAVLPDGKMYYNIAERVVSPLLGENHELVSGAARQVQQSLNEAAGIGLKAQTPPLNTDRVEGIVNKLSSSESYDAVSWVLDEPVKLFLQAAVDELLKENVDFQGKAGLKPRIVRRAESKCCEWCRNLEGVYDYPGLPHDVFRRHNNCRCTLEYDPRDGSRDTLWAKGDAAQRRAQQEAREERISNYNAMSDDAKRKYDSARAARVRYNDNNELMQRRKIGSQGQEIIDKPTYNKITKSFLKNDGIIIRGASATEHLAGRAYASYLPSMNTAIIRDDATVSDVLEEMYHAEQERKNMFGKLVSKEVVLRREIDAQKHLLLNAEKYKIPSSETSVTMSNLKLYEKELEALLEGEHG